MDFIYLIVHLDVTFAAVGYKNILQYTTPPTTISSNFFIFSGPEI
jgi:hypothetical protein